MKSSIAFYVLIAVLCSCNTSISRHETDIIAQGQMPFITGDDQGNLHLVYGTGDSIMYVHSSDRGISFSKPVLISVLPQLTAAHTRGPQIAATADGLVVTACTISGDIFSYTI